MVVEVLRPATSRVNDVDDDDDNAVHLVWCWLRLILCIWWRFIVVVVVVVVVVLMMIMMMITKCFCLHLWLKAASHCPEIVRRWTHKNEASHDLLGIFWHATYFCPPITNLKLELQKLNWWSYKGLRCPHEWPDVFTIRSEFEHFLYRVTICCLFWDLVTPALDRWDDLRTLTWIMQYIWW